MNLASDRLIQYLDVNTEIANNLLLTVKRLESATLDFHRCLYLAHQLGWTVRRIAEVIGATPSWTHRHIRLGEPPSSEVE